MRLLQRQRQLLCVALFSTWLAGCSSESNAYKPRSEPIVGGTLSMRQSVVALQNDLASGYCTATMVSARIAVTAKHCVQRAGADGPDAPTHYTVRTGADVDEPDAILSVASLHALAGVYTSQTTEEDGTLYGIDVGLVVLEDEPSLPTQPITLEPIQRALERSYVTVGYGLTDEGEMGQKREVELSASEVMADRIIAGPVVCLGDSGGPLFDADVGTVFGVTSYGLGACGTGSAAFNTFSGLGELFKAATDETTACVEDTQCKMGNTCLKQESSLGVCGSPDDASARDADVLDGSIALRLKLSATGGACKSGPTGPHTIWVLAIALALARRPRSPVASRKSHLWRQS